MKYLKRISALSKKYILEKIQVDCQFDAELEYTLFYKLWDWYRNLESPRNDIWVVGIDRGSCVQVSSSLLLYPLFLYIFLWILGFRLRISVWRSFGLDSNVNDIFCPMAFSLAFPKIR